MRTDIALLTALLAVLAGVGAPAFAAPGAVGVAAGAESPCAGRITSPAGGLTVVSVQGARFGENRGKTDARVVAFGPNGSIRWVHHSADEYGIIWSYDVDPLPNGNLFVVGTHRGTTVMYELDAETGERLWVRELDMTDTHDADMLDRQHVVIANMRNYNETTGNNNDQVVVYNRTSDEIEWRWRFRDHYDDERIGGEYTDDWTHVNDVERVGPNHFLLSPRNFDQVILVNRTSGDIELTLGEYGNHSILNKQHNPDYLESADGDPTFIVADSDNDRIVEYEHTDDGWRRTWNVGSSETLSWPRDADRLPDGNTLIGDSRNNRVLEVTPEGDVVWEVYAPWLVYDVERIPVDESNGPTIADQNASGQYDLKHAAPPKTDELESCSAAISSFHGGWGEDLATATPGDGASPTADWSGTDDIRKVGPGRDPSLLRTVGLPVAIVALLCGIVVLARHRF